MTHKRLATFLFAHAAILAQSGGPRFDVASLKLAPPEQTAHRSSSSEGRLSFHGDSLRILLLRAYRLKDYQIVATPNIDTPLYNVDATFQAGATREQKQEMLQALLEDRLRLKSHMETREIPAFVLTVAKAGLKVSEIPPSEISPNPPRGSRLTPAGRSLSDRMTIEEVISAVSVEHLDRPLLNLTGLTAKYQVKLDWLPDDLIGHLPPARPGAEAVPPSPDLFVALSQQLGLKVEKRNSPVPMLVVDSFQKTPKEQ